MRAGTTPNGQPRSTALYEAILRLDNLDDCIRFFEDLCAVTELRTMEQRYDVAGCLLQGKVYNGQPGEPDAELWHRRRGQKRPP